MYTKEPQPYNQPQSYVARNETQPRNQQIEMRNYTEQKNPPQQKYQTSAKQYQTQNNQIQDNTKDQQPSNCGYILSWIVFIAAFIVNIGLWALDFFAIGRQASNYYSSNFSISSAIDSVTYTDSTAIVANSSDTLGIAMGLIYSWVLWKFPLVIYSFHLISKREEGAGVKYGTFIGMIIVLLAIDILLTIFALSIYNEYMYFGANFILTLIVALINNSSLNKTKEAATNTIIPLSLIALIFACYSIFLPTLYKVYLLNLTQMSSVFLVIYGYPVVDMILYALTLYLGNKVQDYLKNFFATIHFLMIGYGVGMILIVGYTEVQFYYLIGYFIFKNIFVNWIMRNWQIVVSNPPCLPGWGVLYYVSYGLSFLPVIGVGRLVVSKSFSSFLFAKSSTILYGIANPLYPSNSFPTTSVPTLGINSSFYGSIYWLSGAIIWIAFTFTQRYNRKKPTLYDFFYYLFGIHLFYMGISCSLSVYPLANNGGLIL